MNSKELVLNMMYEQGRADALNLRSRAADMDGTAIIAEETKIPAFDPTKDYTNWVVGSPVYDVIDGANQVFTLLIPHNAAHYPDVRPNNNRTLWSLTHTKDTAKAKPYIEPSGVSGLYMTDEVCTYDGAIWKSLQDNNSYIPGSIGTDDYWVQV